MNMTSLGIVDIKGCQHSKHISISVFQTVRFPKWVKMMYTQKKKFSQYRHYVRKFCKTVLILTKTLLKIKFM